MRYGQLVIGPAGSGKSTYCSTMQKHGSTTGRQIHIVNLDPGAEVFSYEPAADIRDLVQVDDVMEDEDLMYGPNGGLIFCMEHLVQPDGMEWLKDQLGGYDDDYVLFDCPGQIELYTHLDVMNKLAASLQAWDFRLVVVFLLDSHYMVDGAKFLSGTLTALSTMIKLELPHINILSKMDLLSSQAKKQLEMFLEPEVHELLASDHSVSKFNKKFQKLSSALGQVIDEYALVRFVPLNINKEESIADTLLQIDFCIQFGEDADVKTHDYDYQDPEDDDDEELDMSDARRG